MLSSQISLFHREYLSEIKRETKSDRVEFLELDHRHHGEAVVELGAIDVFGTDPGHGECGLGRDRRHAVAWLREVLTGGPLPVKEVRKQADDAGLAWRTVQRAMRDAGVESRRGGFGKPSEWALAPQSRHSRQPFETGANGATGGSGATGEAQEVF